MSRLIHKSLAAAALVYETVRDDPSVPRFGFGGDGVTAPTRSTGPL